MTYITVPLLCVFVLEHVIGYGGCNLLSRAILSKVVHKAPVGTHQVHDDGVVHLQRGYVTMREV